MYINRSEIDRDIAVPGRRLWSLPAALEHLKTFVADRSGQAGKSAVLQVSCPAALVSQRTIDAIVPTLAQMLRNAVEHGVEHPVARLTAGKPLTAIITLEVSLSGDRMLVAVTDDGAGFDPATADIVRGNLRDVAQLGRIAVDGESRRAALLRHGIFLTDRNERSASGLERAAARTSDANGEISFVSEPGEGTTFYLAIATPMLLPETLGDLDEPRLGRSIARASL